MTECLKKATLILANIVLVKCSCVALLSLALLFLPSSMLTEGLRESAEIIFYCYFSFVGNLIGVVVILYIIIGVPKRDSIFIHIGLVGTFIYLIHDVPMLLVISHANLPLTELMIMNMFGSAVVLTSFAMTLWYWRRELRNPSAPAA